MPMPSSKDVDVGAIPFLSRIGRNRGVPAL